MLELPSHSFLPEACLLPFPSNYDDLGSCCALRSTPIYPRLKVWHSFPSSTKLILVNWFRKKKKKFCGALRGQGSYLHVFCMLHDRAEGIWTPPNRSVTWDVIHQMWQTGTQWPFQGHQKGIFDEEDVHIANQKKHAWNADFLFASLFLFINQTLF